MTCLTGAAAAFTGAASVVAAFVGFDAGAAALAGAGAALVCVNEKKRPKCGQRMLMLMSYCCCCA